MRRLQAILGAVLLLIAVPSTAQSRVDTVRVDVTLSDDGSALVRERWVIDVADNITEWYLSRENLGGMEILDFSVTDESGAVYSSDGTRWDIHRSRQAKARRCGIVPKRDGCELCWGVGSSGRHAYVASYTMTGLVKAYSDKDGFNHMFVTPSDGEPRNVLLTIRKSGTILTSDNTSLWGFRFRGEAEVIDGAVRYWSTEPFGDESALIALVGFDKGIFTPSVAVDKSFEEVKKEALKDSDYRKDSEWGAILMGLIPILLFFLPVFIGIYKVISDNRRKKALLGGKMKNVSWFRDVPVGGDLRKASNILRLFSGKAMTENQNLIAAYMMRLFYDGAFELVTQASGSPAFKINEFSLPDGADMDRLLEKELYGFFKEAAGDDRVLQKKELRKWANRNGKALYDWQRKTSDGSTLRTLKAEDVRQVFGLKRFLKDFTLIKDRGAVEVSLWNNYLIFASLYGIADQVYKDFKKVCPEYFTLSRSMSQVQDATPVVLWNTIGDTSRYFNQSAYSFASRQRSSSGNTRWSGGGGMTSFGGGGSFSGGGHSGGR